MFQQQKTKAFTLVELIVVITILAILGTIAFISLQGYSKTARDSVRISDMKNIEKGFELELTKRGKVTIPEEKVNITASGTLMNYQGYATEDVLVNIGVHGGGKDPLDEEYYTYMTNKDLTKYQILGYLEREDGLSLVKGSYAANLNNRLPYVLGNQLGILLNSGSMTPIQDSFLDLDIVNTNDNYIAYLDNENIVSGTGNKLFTGIYHGNKIYLKNMDLAKFDNSLVLYYDMETTSMSGSLSLVKDFSGYGNDGSCYVSSILKDCGFGDSAIFHVSNNNISIKDNSSLDLKNLTISTLIKTYNLPAGYATNPIKKQTDTLDSNYNMYYIRNSGLISLHGNAGGDWKALISAAGIGELVINSEQHVLFTYGNGGGKMYINGKKVLSQDYVGELYLNDANLYLGGFDGEMDEVRIYNRELNDNEVYNIYNSIK